MKKLIKEILPPRLLRLFAKTQVPQSFSSFIEASNSGKNITYEQDELIDVVLEKNKIYRSLSTFNEPLNTDTIRVLMAVGLAINENKIKVIDFGGGGGNHFTVTSMGFSDLDSIEWNIVETNRFVQRAKEINVPGLRFFDRLELANKAMKEPDLLLASSTLQYCPDPIDMLDRLTKIGAKYIFLTRTPFNSGHQSIYSVQSSWLSGNGPGPLPEGFIDRQIFYPITYASRLQIEKTLILKYDIKFRTDEGVSPAFNVRGENITMSGYFCKLKKT